jgi:hypothetical protein
MADAIQSVLDPFLAASDAALGGTYSAILYGSAARGDFVPGRSDVNLLVVVDDISMPTLRALAPAFDGWRRSSQEPPLLLSREEWAEAADVFPIEITDMRSAYRVVRGGDPLEALHVAPADLRRALEREFRGKLLRLRQAYVALSADQKALSSVAADSVATMLVLYRALLALLGKEIPADPIRLVSAGASASGIDPSPLTQIVSGRGQKGWTCNAAQFESYISAVAQTAEFVDHLQIGAQ